MKLNFGVDPKQKVINLYRRQYDKCILCGNFNIHYEQAFGCVNYERKVFGRGDINADVVLVGEAPGAKEERLREPFIGRSGQYLSSVLGNLRTCGVYITNVLLCRPPNDRDPTPMEVANCVPRLKREIEIIRPRVIVTLGNFATKALTKTRLGITKIHGQYDKIKLQLEKGELEVYFIPVYHPAFVIRRGGVYSSEHAEFVEDMAMAFNLAGV